MKTLLSVALVATISTQAMYNKIPSKAQHDALETTKAAIVVIASGYHKEWQRIDQLEEKNSNIHTVKEQRHAAEKKFFELIGIDHRSPWLIGHPYNYDPKTQTPEQWVELIAKHPLYLKDLAKTLNVDEQVIKNLPSAGCVIL